MLMSTESPYHFAHLLQVLKQSLWSMIFNTFLMILYMYIAPGKGRQPFGDKPLMSTESSYHCPFVTGCFEVRFYIHFFHVSPYVYSPRQGQTNHWGQNSDDNRKAFSLCPYLASFKMISSKSDFIQIFNDFIHVYSPGARAENPLGMNFLCQQKALITLSHFDHSLQVSNKSLWILILYTVFNVFPHVYSPGAGTDNHLWTKSWCLQKSLVTLPIYCKFRRNIFEVWFYT